MWGCFIDGMQQQQYIRDEEDEFDVSVFASTRSARALEGLTAQEIVRSRIPPPPWTAWRARGLRSLLFDSSIRPAWARCFLTSISRTSIRFWIPVWLPGVGRGACAFCGSSVALRTDGYGPSQLKWTRAFCQNNHTLTKSDGLTICVAHCRGSTSAHSHWLITGCDLRFLVRRPVAWAVQGLCAGPSEAFLVPGLMTCRRSATPKCE